MKFLAGLLGVLVACVPVAIILTLLTWPFWGWVEEVTGIESLGHSGPADWCFCAVYTLCAAAGIVLLIKLRRKNVPPINPP
jgi:hypothetical protein